MFKILAVTHSQVLLSNVTAVHEGGILKIVNMRTIYSLTILIFKQYTVIQLCSTQH